MFSTVCKECLASPYIMENIPNRLNLLNQVKRLDSFMIYSSSHVHVIIDDSYCIKQPSYAAINGLN